MTFRNGYDDPSNGYSDVSNVHLLGENTPIEEMSRAAAETTAEIDRRHIPEHLTETRKIPDADIPGAGVGVEQPEPLAMIELMQGLDVESGADIQVVLRSGVRMNLKMVGVDGHLIQGILTETWLSPKDDGWGHTGSGKTFQVRSSIVLDRREIVAVMMQMGDPEPQVTAYSPASVREDYRG